MHNKGQEEITGFVLVIIVVSVIGLFLLTLGVRNSDNSVRTDSFAIRQFLDSSMKVTSECPIRSSLDYSSLDELIRACYIGSGQVCYNSGEPVCNVMNDSISAVLDTLRVGPDSVYKGYLFNITFERQVGEEIVSSEQFFSESAGNCSLQQRAGEYLTRVGSEQGLLVSTLTLCN